MYSPMSSMPPDSRVWVYQSNREFSSQEVAEIVSKTKSFLESWTAHNLDLKASFEIRYNRFLLILIDEKQAAAGGCSIDKSVHFIQQLENEYQVKLMDRFLFAFKKGEHVNVATRPEFEKLIEQGDINEHTIVFNNLVQSKHELDNSWEIPLSKSWHKSLLEI